MGNQRTFASLAWNGKGKVTRRERFLAEMDAVARAQTMFALANLYQVRRQLLPAGASSAL